MHCGYLKVTESMTEKLKANNQTEWIRTVNSIYHCAEEIVLNENVYK